ncbi:MAG TPA: pyruvate dehydrogenase complex dihydrolipoamide acetyltransferase [Gemmatimonadetes bacterium]|nr:pyruvate dehydrogenase complex dihydrolipoamide acetyltransferase [Gemmatimonadota bacterium]HIN51900.1 pyruvate dehydrogenase complex dihydrolipoamide acetyltransferase [Gemmatimonadota bacterium]
MATKVHMEALSPTMEEGQLVQWLKAEGDDIANGDILAEIETDKATMELVARGEGVLRKIFLTAGGTAEVGSVIGVIAGADEDISGIAGVSGGGATAAPTAPPEALAEVAPMPAAQTLPAPEAPAVSAPATSAPATTAAATLPASAANGGRVKASPLARRLAEEMGVDIARVPGSGPGGRVVKRDVEAAKASGVAAPVDTPATWASDGAEYEDIPTSQMRKAIAKRLVTSIGPVPTFYLTVDVDMARVIEARKSINAMLEKDGMRVSINDILLKAIAAALRQHPNCNAQWHDGFVRRFNAVHLGVAVAIEDGLITPVIKNAHAKGIAQISAEVRELAGRAREKKLMPDEYTGSTFTVSNLGMLGIHEFTAIINPPESGILAVGGIVETPVVVDGEVTVRPRMRITMSCDHRVIDGAQGARFLQTLQGMLEEPTAILL